MAPDRHSCSVMVAPACGTTSAPCRRCCATSRGRPMGPARLRPLGSGPVQSVMRVRRGPRRRTRRVRGRTLDRRRPFVGCEPRTPVRARTSRSNPRVALHLGYRHRAGVESRVPPRGRPPAHGGGERTPDRAEAAISYSGRGVRVPAHQLAFRLRDAGRRSRPDRATRRPLRHQLRRESPDQRRDENVGRERSRRPVPGYNRSDADRARRPRSRDHHGQSTRSQPRCRTARSRSCRASVIFPGSKTLTASLRPSDRFSPACS